MRQAITILVIAAVVIGGWLWLGHWQAAAPQAPADTAATSSVPAASSSPATSTARKTAGGSRTLTYTEAVATFRDRRMQFDTNCVATPNSMVLKDRTYVMFDNRSPSKRYFALNGERHLLSGYGFVILELDAPKLPYTIIVDCGSGRNNAQIILN